MRCTHYEGEGYQYRLSDKEMLYLCEFCNMNLAGELMKQLAILSTLCQQNNTRKQTENDASYRND